MRIGTKSLLFGVHNFLWHPYTVLRAWQDCYGCLPKWPELVAICLHDCGYWGKPNMDGPEGQLHPIGGALLTGRVVYFFSRNAKLAAEAQKLSLYHSRYFARLAGEKPSALFLPDKLCVRYDPPGWYLLRAALSGEIREYLECAAGSGRKFSTRRAWYRWYREKVEGFCERVW